MNGELLDSGMSKSYAVIELKISLVNFKKCMKEEILPQLHKSLHNSDHPRPIHQLDPVKDAILDWIFEHHDQGAWLEVSEHINVCCHDANNVG